MKTILTIFIIIILLSSCKTIDYSKGWSVYVEDKQGITVTSDWMPSVREALDNALEKAGAEYNALINITISKDSKSSYLFNKSAYRVKATAICTWCE